jgi:superfamily I DNA/RNA helicase/RecB family exonuclease
MTYRWIPEAHRLLDPASRGLVRVLGGPGTGKSSLLVDAAAAHIAAGTDPESVLLLTGSGPVGVRARSALTTTLLAARANTDSRLPAVIREPLVRTVHGYAFAVLRLAARRAGDPPPRLVTGAEQDSVIRELLAGDDADAWPESLHPALGTAGFATELRNLLARCAERGVDPAQLARLGRRSRRPEWAAAGRFAQQYEQVMLLRAAVGAAAPTATVPALGAAELIGAALDAFAADPGLLAAERARIRLLLVDDAQQLDPQAARLVRVLAAGAGLAIVAGDPNQAVFGFRGAEATALLTDDPLQAGGGTTRLRGSAPTPAVTLTASHRCAPAVARAISGIAERLPGAAGETTRLRGSARQLDGTGTDTGSVTVQPAASGHAEAAVIADTLRRAHLISRVPWSQMAVIVRSVPRAAGGLPRALADAGVPVVLPPAGGSLSERPAAAALLTVLAATADGLDGECALALLTGPIGRIDPVLLRQLRRSLRRTQSGHLEAEPACGESREFGELLVAALNDDRPDRLSASHARPLRRVRAVLDAAARSDRAGQDPRYTLWQAWQRSGLQQRWLAASARGGPAGARADADLDAVTALFDIAEQYVSQTAGASLRGLIEHVAALRLGAPRADPVTPAEAVKVLSAHAALGHEWDLVVIAGLQEGLWPNTVPRGGVLGTQRLLDVLDGVGADASARAPLLAEERRLLIAAMGRARHRLLVTAVDGAAGDTGDEVPSGFFYELIGWATGDTGTGVAPVAAPQVLSAAAVVGRLRGVVCASAGAVGDDERRCAARQLARLAEVRVPGADPAGWHGMVAVSTDEPLWAEDDGHVVTLSPSSLQTLLDCPLRWLAERYGGTDRRDLRSALGSLLHALVAEPDSSAAELVAQLDRVWDRLPFAARWYAANELTRHRAMLDTFVQWRAATRDQLTEDGVEVDVDGVVIKPDTPGDGGPGIRLRGRVDRVERDAAGRVVVVDVKTGKTPVSKDDAQQHAQLALYQLAIAEGLSAAGDEPGGARLVYLGKPGAAGATERQQDPLTPAARDTWRDLIRQAAAATAGPQFVARVNDGCRHCPIRPSCPAHTEGSGR